MNALKSQICSLTSFVGIPHDVTYKEDNKRLMMGVRKGILNDHLIVCETLQQYVFKEKFIGEEFHRSTCPFHLLSFICRCNKHHNVAPMLLSQSPSSSLFKRGLRKKMTLWDATGADTQGVNTAGRCDESTIISATPKQHACSRAKLFNVVQRDDGAT